MDDPCDLARAKALVRSWVAMFNSGDLVAADEIVADVYLEHAIAPFAATEPGLVEGPSHVRQTADWLLAQFPDLTMRIDALIAEGDLVSALVAASGTNLGTVDGPVGATRRTFSASQTHWFRIRGGRLAEHWATRDDLRVMVQLGIVSPPSPASKRPRGR